MTPSLARALADSDWAVRVAAKAIKRLLEFCEGKEPRGLLRDVIKLVASIEEIEEARRDAVERVEALEVSLEDRIEVEKMLNEEIDALREKVKKLEQSSEPPAENVDVLDDALKVLGCGDETLEEP